MEKDQNKKDPQNNEETEDNQLDEVEQDVKNINLEQENEKLQKIKIDNKSITKLSQLYNLDQQIKDSNLIKERIFWDTQPVPKITDYEEQTENFVPGIIDEVKTVDQVKKTPYNIPDTFEWVDINLKDGKDAQDVYTLLTENYVEDDDAMFRFDYSIEFLRWTLLNPGYFPDWHVGVRVKKSKKLIGFITAIPLHTVTEFDHKMKMAEVNFLCVHKKMRAHRLAPVLIKEITRRVNLRNIWQAIYTAGVLIPTPIGRAQYFHRSLNPKKLIEVQFSSLGPNQTISRLIKLYKLPDEPKIAGIRPMKTKDVVAVVKLLNEYHKQFKLYNKFTEEEVKHFFIPRKDVIYSYVVEQDKNITDFVSFYCLPSSILKNPKHTTLRAAYSYYNVATTHNITELFNDAIILAKNEDFDVFNALNIMKNAECFEELKFSPGDGFLNYYLYNWRVSQKVTSQEIGMVLV